MNEIDFNPGFVDRETEESDQKLEYNRNKKMMQADERVKEWKKVRVDAVRKKVS